MEREAGKEGGWAGRGGMGGRGGTGKGEGECEAVREGVRSR